MSIQSLAAWLEPKKGFLLEGSWFVLLVVIAEGMESGGHVGEITTMALVPQIVDAVSIPVIAAGGIGDARGVVAALALGAQGVQIGTRFVASTECIAHPNFKEVILRAKDRSTVVTGLSTGHPVRVIGNKLARNFTELERQGASLEELERLGAGKLKAAALDGDIQYGSVMAGQVAGIIHSIKPADEIIQEIVDEIPKIIKGIISNWCMNRHSAIVKWRCKYNIVFAPKYRRQVIYRK